MYSLKPDLKIGTPNTIAHITGTQQTATTTLKLNRTNSNIVTAFNSSPETISLGARFDFGDNTNNHDYFVNSTSTIKLISEIEIPLYGWFKVSLSDTLNLDLTPTDSMDFNVDDANIIFTFLIKNQIPINIYLQVTFLNDANQTLALLFDGTPEEMLVKSADVDANGISTNTANKKTDIRITKTKYNLMAKATKMVISYRLNTGGNLNQAVKILSTNKIGIQASISISGIIKPEL